MSVDREHVTEALKKEGLSVTATFNKRNAWVVSFEAREGGEAQAVMLLESGEYFLMFAPIGSQRRIETLSAEVLRQMIKLGSSVPLAKLEYLTEEGLWAATSACSVEAYTGAKLRKRMEACALLTERLEKIM